MVWWWWIAPAVIILICGIVLIRSLIAMGKGKWGRGVVGIIVPGAIIWLASMALMFGMNVQTYARMTYERPVATIDVRKLENQLYEITLSQPPLFAGRPDRTAVYKVHGDDWRIEAQVLKWKPWANRIGLDSQYRLDRLSGRYSTVEQELSATRSAYDLGDAEEIALNGQFPFKMDAWDMIRRYRQHVDAADTLYGSAAYMPMADGARYEVWITQSGLIARPTNDAARNASAGGWTMAN